MPKIKPSRQAIRATGQIVDIFENAITQHVQEFAPDIAIPPFKMSDKIQKVIAGLIELEFKKEMMKKLDKHLGRGHGRFRG